MNSEQSRRQTILVVEDDAMLRGILAQALADEGHSVLTAADGEEALAITSTLDGQLGLVVIDLMLPLMDGLGLADHLTQLNPSTSNAFHLRDQDQPATPRSDAGQTFRPRDFPRPRWPDAPDGSTSLAGPVHLGGRRRAIVTGPSRGKTGSTPLSGAHE
jgi:CheY-like chemotaxis protein